MEYKIGEDGRILDHRNAEILNEDRPLSINAYVMRLDDLIDLAERSLREGKHSFRRDLFFPMIDSGEKVMGYEVPGAVLYMDDLSTYLKNSLELLNKDVRDSLFHVDGRPILTNVKDSAPARYGDNAKVVNSLMDKLAAKCRIQQKQEEPKVNADSLLERLNLMKNWR